MDQTVSVEDILYIIAVICFIVAFFHGFIAMMEFREDRKRAAMLLGPAALFVSTLYTKKGNYHRKMSSLFLLMFGMFFLFASIVEN